MVERRTIVLTHAPVISLGAEETVDEDDWTALGLLLGLIQVVSHLDAIAELRRRIRSFRMLSEGLLETWKSSACEHRADLSAPSKILSLWLSEYDHDTI